MKNWRGDRWFLIGLAAVWAAGMAMFVLPEKQASEIENRNFAMFPQFDMVSFLEGAYQDELEAAMSDQFVGSEAIKMNYNQVLMQTPTFGWEERLCGGHYLGTADGKRAVFDCEALVYRPAQAEAVDKGVLERNLARFNAANKVAEAYYYFINDSSVMNFETGEKVGYVGMLAGGLTGKYRLASFDYGSFQEYREYFYRTDHHWNYKGSYRGYREIAELLGVKEKLAEPAGEVTGKAPFFGTYASAARNLNYPEDFTIYQYNLPEHSVTVDGRGDKYGSEEEFAAGKEYSGYKYYGDVYGGDNAEVAIDYHRAGKENLLVIGNSYDNPIGEVLAQHFDKTYIVDLRYYYNVYGREFSLAEYVSEKEIDKVLFVMSPSFILGEENVRGLEAGA